MKLRVLKLLVSTAILAAMAPLAVAQDNPYDRSRHTAVTARQQPAFDPEPIRAGAFTVASSLGVAGEYNDNVFGTSSNETDDTIIRLTPKVEARSNWSVHEVLVGATVDYQKYSDNDTETHTDYNVYAAGRLDVTREVHLRGRANLGHVTEQRFQPGSTGTAEPAEYDNHGVEAGVEYRADRVKLEVTAGTREEDFDNKRLFGFRDATFNSVAGRASYAISPDVAVFADVRQVDISYDQAGSNRDGKQTSYTVGVNFELDAPFRGEFQIGQVKDNKDSPLLRDTDALSLHGRMEWFPTQLTTVSLTADAGVSDPGLPQAASAKYSSVSLRADHELLRNLLLYAQFGWSRYDFNAPVGSTFSRKDDLTTLEAGMAWKLNKHAHIEASYALRSRDTKIAGPNADLDQQVIGVGLRVFP